MAYYYNQTAYDNATDPLWSTPEMTEVELKVALLPADKLAMVEQEAEDCGANFNKEYCWSETAKLAADKWNARKRKTNVFKRLFSAIRG